MPSTPPPPAPTSCWDLNVSTHGHHHHHRHVGKPAPALDEAPLDRTLAGEPVTWVSREPRAGDEGLTLIMGGRHSEQWCFSARFFSRSASHPLVTSSAVLAYTNGAGASEATLRAALELYPHDSRGS